jgi:HKD family nuclease
VPNILTILSNIEVSVSPIEEIKSPAYVNSVNLYPAVSPYVSLITEYGVGSSAIEGSSAYTTNGVVVNEEINLSY